MSEETVSGTHGTTPKENVDYDVEGEDMTGKVNTIKNQENHQYMEHMLGKGDHPQKIMSVHTVQQMASTPHSCNKHQQSNPNPSQTPSTAMGRFSPPDLNHLAEFAPVGFSEKAVAIFIVVIVVPLLLSAVLAPAMATPSCYEYLHTDKDDNNKTARDNIQDGIIFMPDIAQIEHNQIDYKNIKHTEDDKIAVFKSSLLSPDPVPMIENHEKVRVGLSIEVMDIQDITEVDKTFQVPFMLYLPWNDGRLQYNNLNRDKEFNLLSGALVITVRLQYHQSKDPPRCTVKLQKI